MRKKIDVEQLVTWAMLNQGLGWSAGQSAGMSFMELGTRIDRSSMSAPSIALQTDDDALIVRSVIEMLPPEDAEMVIRHGRIGERPEWCPDGPGEHRQRRNRRGQPMWIYDNPKNRRSQRHPMMEWIGDRPEQVAFWRANYRVWWFSLEAIVPELNARLHSHEATGPAAPLEPWAEPEKFIHTPDGTIKMHRSTRRNAGVERYFVLKDGRYERYDEERHGPVVEGDVDMHA